jgi:alkylated DNA repair dioxygenase AlkB
MGTVVFLFYPVSDVPFPADFVILTLVSRNPQEKHLKKWTSCSPNPEPLGSSGTARQRRLALFSNGIWHVARHSRRLTLANPSKQLVWKLSRELRPRKGLKFPERMAMSRFDVVLVRGRQPILISNPKVILVHVYRCGKEMSAHQQHIQFDQELTIAEKLLRAQSLLLPWD